MKKLIMLIPVLIVFSCGGGESAVSTTIEDSVKSIETSIDSVATTVEETIEEEVSAAGKTIEEVEKSGGLSFCDCVKKQKEIDDKMVLVEADDEVEALLEESEKLRNGECSVLKAGNQMTAAEKKAREAKVKACLGN